MKLRARFWLETVLATATGLIAALTAVWQNWVEIVFRVDPDGHSGALEWSLLVAFATSSAVLAFAARHEWKRAVGLAAETR